MVSYMMKDKYDVILVGGGIMGCATAYYLMKNDQRLKVAIIEKDPTYAKASTTLSDGNIRVQFNLKENILISQYGLEIIETFAEDMAVGDDKPDVGYRRQGDLFLYDNEGISAAKGGFELQKELGVASNCGSCKEAATQILQENRPTREKFEPRVYVPSTA